VSTLMKDLMIYPSSRAQSDFVHARRMSMYDGTEFSWVSVQRCTCPWRPMFRCGARYWMLPRDLSHPSWKPGACTCCTLTQGLRLLRTITSHRIVSSSTYGLHCGSFRTRRSRLWASALACREGIEHQDHSQQSRLTC